jgi:kinesin family protein C2/C3
MKGKIRVMCRTRPISGKETTSGQKMACEFPDTYTISVSSSNQTKTFSFDRVFSPDTTQDEVFSDTSVCSLSFDASRLRLLTY